MRARHALAFVGDTVGLLLLLFLRLLPCRPCRSNELTGRVARIGPCFDVEHGEDFRIRCDPDILSYRQLALEPSMLASYRSLTLSFFDPLSLIRACAVALKFALFLDFFRSLVRNLIYR